MIFFFFKPENRSLVQIKKLSSLDLAVGRVTEIHVWNEEEQFWKYFSEHTGQGKIVLSGSIVVCCVVYQLEPLQRPQNFCLVGFPQLLDCHSFLLGSWPSNGMLSKEPF